MAGGSNTEVASSLFMSLGTVKTHLAHVYAKLGISSRTDLVRLAAAMGTEPALPPCAGLNEPRCGRHSPDPVHR